MLSISGAKMGVFIFSKRRFLNTCVERLLGSIKHAFSRSIFFLSKSSTTFPKKDFISLK